ncbi:MAG: CRTAC1 family protein [Parvularculaceae bacterium]
MRSRRHSLTLRTAGRIAGSALAIAFLAGCSSADGGGDAASAGASATPSPAPAPTPSPAPPPATGTSAFVDATAASGIGFTSRFATGFVQTSDIPIILPSGVAAGDYDNDGDVDLIVTRGELAANLLYENRGLLRFEDVAAEAGLAFVKSATENYRSASPGFADLDGDDDLDIVLPGLDGDPTLVFENNGDGTFTDVSAGSGLDAMTADHSMSPAFGDYDRDGDLDLMFGHWGSRRDFDNGPGDTEHLWRNDTDAGGIRCASGSEAAGSAPSILTNDDPLIPQRRFDNTFAPTFADIDGDGWPDVFVVGDFNFSQIFINQRDGTFVNATDFSVIIDGNGMGSAVQDYDGDGDVDWFVSSILARGGPPPSLSEIGNRLYRNDAGVLVEVSDAACVADGGLVWGSCFLDLENDGDLDVYHTNGWPRELDFGAFDVDASRAFVSNGDGTFVEMAEDLGLDDAEEGRGVVCADFDLDGDVDVLQLHRDTTNAATLWENTARDDSDDGAGFMLVRLLGLAPNTGAVGARIELVADGRTQTRTVTLGSNFASHNPLEQHFGVGAAERVDSVRVVWPAGEETVLVNPAINQRLTIAHPNRP